MRLTEIRQQTELHGEGWALPHAERLLALAAAVLSEGGYDREALTYAAYLHDWAALAHWGGARQDHAARSADIAHDVVLLQTDLDPARQALVVKAIAYHDYRDERTPPSSEALLLREVDMLDMLGVIGIAREFSSGPRDLQAVVRRSEQKQALIVERLTLPAARALAADRLARMGLFPSQLAEESLGWL
jgi:HD superfamily phosphodiesterase